MAGQSKQARTNEIFSRPWTVIALISKTIESSREKWNIEWVLCSMALVRPIDEENCLRSDFTICSLLFKKEYVFCVSGASFILDMFNELLSCKVNENFVVVFAKSGSGRMRDAVWCVSIKLCYFRWFILNLKKCGCFTRWDYKREEIRLVSYSTFPWLSL